MGVQTYSHHCIYTVYIYIYIFFLLFFIFCLHYITFEMPKKCGQDGLFLGFGTELQSQRMWRGKENHFNLPVILSQLCNLRLTDFNAAGFIGGIFLISGKRESSWLGLLTVVSLFLWQWWGREFTVCPEAAERALLLTDTFSFFPLLKMQRLYFHVHLQCT